MGGEAGRAPSGGLRSCACSRTGWGRHHHHQSTAGRVVSPCSIMMHHGIRSIEARRARRQKYRSRQTTSHSSLLVARQVDVYRKLNQAFLLVDSFYLNFVDEEPSDIYTRMYCLNITAVIKHSKQCMFFLAL